MSIRDNASQMATALANKEISAVELTNQHYQQIEAVDKDVHAFLHLDKEGAISQATEIDKKRAAGEKLSPLAGVPLALKDVLTQKGVPTTCGSKILEGWRPPYDSTVVSKLKPGSKAANRRKSFCARMSGMKKRLTSAKTAKDPNSRINKSLRKWNC